MVQIYVHVYVRPSMCLHWARVARRCRSRELRMCVCAAVDALEAWRQTHFTCELYRWIVWLQACNCDVTPALSAFRRQDTVGTWNSQRL